MEAIDTSGQIVAQGSGVVIAHGVVVSNCHVFAETQTQSASASYRNERFPATLRYADTDHDLCSFTVNGLPAPPIKMRHAATLKVGEDAYAIGTPEGFQLTLSSGIISSLRELPGGAVIQMTTPISPGSSGGGLFDSEGRLIGITSYYMGKGQQLNFALPVEWIEALPQRGKTLREISSQLAKQHSSYQQAVQAGLSGDYATALAILKPLAEHGDSDAQLQLGWMYDNHEGVPKNETAAAYWYLKAAAQGNAGAQNNIGLMYDNGRGVPQDYSKAADWYLKAATQGNATAQRNIALMYSHGQGVEQNYNSAFIWFSKAAAQGNADAENTLGSIYAKGHGVPQDYAKAAYWHRKAAEQGVVNAQAALGGAYSEGFGVPQDNVLSAKWLILAQAGGNEEAGELLSMLAQDMSSEQIAQAQSRARKWWATHHNVQNGTTP